MNYDAKAKFVSACERAGITPELAKSSCRFHDVAALRAKAMVIMHHEYGWSFPRIGQLLNKDHSTCVYHVHRALGTGKKYEQPPRYKRYDPQKYRDYRDRKRACGLEIRIVK